MNDTTGSDSAVDLTTWRELLSDWGRTGRLRRQSESESDSPGNHLASLRAELADDAAKNFVPIPCPKIVLNPKSSGSSDVPISAAPGGIPAFRKSVRKAQTTRVSSPSMIPRGMSR